MFGLLSPPKSTTSGMMSVLALFLPSGSEPLLLYLLKIDGVGMDMFSELSRSLQNLLRGTKMSFSVSLPSGSIPWVLYLLKMYTETSYVLGLLSPFLKSLIESGYFCSGSYSFFPDQHLDFYFYSNVITTPQCVRPALSFSQNGTRGFQCLFWLFLFVLDQSPTYVTEHL